MIYFNDEGGIERYLIGGGIFLLLLTWNLVMVILGFKKKKYALRDKDILYTKD